MGGTYERKNFKVVGVQQHFDIWGPILGLVKDVPVARPRGSILLFPVQTVPNERIGEPVVHWRASCVESVRLLV